MSLIIGFSGKKNAGKDTVVSHLIERHSTPNFTISRYSFGDLVKIEAFDAEQFLRFVCPLPIAKDHKNCMEQRIYTKQEKLDFLNVQKHNLSCRKSLQVYGTDYRRGQDPDYWLNQLMNQIDEEEPDIALIPDVRFENEADVCDLVVRVERLGETSGDSHVSETALDDYPFDHRLQAFGGAPDALNREADSYFDPIFKRFWERKERLDSAVEKLEQAEEEFTEMLDTVGDAA